MQIHNQLDFSPVLPQLISMIPQLSSQVLVLLVWQRLQHQTWSTGMMTLGSDLMLESSKYNIHSLSVVVENNLKFPLHMNYLVLF